MNRIAAHLTRRVVRVDGDAVDAAAAARLEAPLLAAAHAGPLVLDLGGVRFADSAGLGLLARLHRAGGGSVRLANVGPALQRCLARAAEHLLPPVLTLEVPPRPEAVTAVAPPGMTVA